MGTVSFVGGLADITIETGQTSSRIVNAAYETADATAVTLMAPATLDAATFTLEGSQDGTTFYTLNDGSSDIGPPAVNKCRQYTELMGYQYWRIKSSGSAAAPRTWKASKQWTI